MLIFVVNSGSTEMGHGPDDSPRTAGTFSTVGSTSRMKATEVPLDHRRQSWCRARQRAGDSHVSRDGCLESGTELQQPCPQNASNIRASERKHPEERRDDRNGPRVVRKPVLTALSEMYILHLRVLGNWSHSSMVAPTSRVTRTSSFTTRWMWEREKKGGCLAQRHHSSQTRQAAVARRGTISSCELVQKLWNGEGSMADTSEHKKSGTRNSKQRGHKNQVTTSS